MVKALEASFLSSPSADAASMARFLSAIQLEVAGLGNKIDEKMKANFAQHEASLLHKV